MERLALTAHPFTSIHWTNASRIRLLMRLGHAERFYVVFLQTVDSFLIFPILLSISGCSAEPECDSSETRLAVLKTVSDDHNNALGKYAKNSTAKPGDASSEAQKSVQQPLNLLDEKIITTSTSADKRTVTCSGSMSVTVGDAKASKEVEFTAQQSGDGKMSVSVTSFQF